MVLQLSIAVPVAEAVPTAAMPVTAVPFVVLQLSFAIPNVGATVLVAVPGSAAPPNLYFGKSCLKPNFASGLFSQRVLAE